MIGVIKALTTVYLSYVLAGSFIYWEWLADPSEWPEIGRLVFVLLTCVLTLAFNGAFEESSP